MSLPFYYKSGRREVWTKRLCLITLLLLCLNIQGAHSSGIISRISDVVRDLPQIGLALKTSALSILRNIFHSNDATARSSIGTIEVSPDTYCYGELGCIAITDDFYHPIHRPINLAPGKREDVAVAFKISSKDDVAGMIVPWNDITKAKESSFKSSRKTKVVIHGFMNGREAPFMEEVSRAFLRQHDVNVIWIDWSDGSLALYNRAVANSRIVALELAHFLKWLIDNMSLNPADIHIIGHSLGAHIAGYVGEKIPGLGRITGLDPAEPFFQYLPTTVRLDPTDANFVDVIHTDSESILNLGQGFGLRQPIGHLDFYPNDGKKQPGCDSPLAVPFRRLAGKKTSFKRVWDSLGCSHRRAVELFIESIESQCPFMAFQCDSYEDYMSGECLSCGKDGYGCASMGLHADTWLGAGKGKEPIQLFYSAGTGPTFCRYHYQILLKLGDLPGAGWDRMGKLNTSFVDGEGRKLSFDLTSGRSKQFTSKGLYSFFLDQKDDLGDLREAQVTWTMSSRGSRSTQTSLSIKKLAIRNVDTHPLRNRLARGGRSESTFFFCENSGDPVTIPNRETVALQASANNCNQSD